MHHFNVAGHTAVLEINWVIEAPGDNETGTMDRLLRGVLSTSIGDPGN